MSYMNCPDLVQCVPSPLANLCAPHRNHSPQRKMRATRSRVELRLSIPAHQLCRVTRWVTLDWGSVDITLRRARQQGVDQRSSQMCGALCNQVRMRSGDAQHNRVCLAECSRRNGNSDQQHSMCGACPMPWWVGVRLETPRDSCRITATTLGRRDSFLEGTDVTWIVYARSPHWEAFNQPWSS